MVIDYGGHGVGNDFHEEPFVHHVGIKGQGMILAPGMVFTVEPMINEGEYRLFIDADNGWTSYTEDGKLSPNGKTRCSSQKKASKNWLGNGKAHRRPMSFS